MAKTVFVCTFM